MTETIGYRGCHYEENRTLMELMLLLVAQEIPDDSHFAGKRDYWVGMIRSGFNTNGVSFDLMVQDPSAKDEWVSYLDRAQKRIRDFGVEIPVETLNAWFTNNGVRFGKPIPTLWVWQTIQRAILLLAGSDPSKVPHGAYLKADDPIPPPPPGWPSGPSGPTGPEVPG